MPLHSVAFGPAAQSVRAGFEAAARLEPSTGLDITIYATTEDPTNIIDGYRQALADAPRLVVGPLTRNGVSAVAQRMQPGTPVLALNVPDNDTPLPDGFYTFSLQVEAEARQIARMAYSEGRRSALTLADEHALTRRIHHAFVEEFTRLGGRIVGQFAYRNSTADLMALHEAATSNQCDMVFIALGAARARAVRGYIDGQAQAYATSQVLQGEVDRLRDAELNGVRFVAMPWLIERDHPAVMVYSGASTQAPAATDRERLYAFGIDAYRIAAALLRGTDLSREPLDGVTGRIVMAPSRHFVRELTPAQFVDGRAVPIATRP